MNSFCYFRVNDFKHFFQGIFKTSFEEVGNTDKKKNHILLYSFKIVEKKIPNLDCVCVCRFTALLFFFLGCSHQRIAGSKCKYIFGTYSWLESKHQLTEQPARLVHYIYMGMSISPFLCQNRRLSFFLSSLIWSIKKFISHHCSNLHFWLV